MNRGYAIFIALSLLSAGFIVSTWLIVYRLFPQDRSKQILRWLGVWSAKGFALPIALWTFLNIGFGWSLQPFLPEIQFAKSNGKPWGGVFFEGVGYGLFLVSSYWAALTLAWAIKEVATRLEGDQRSDFKGLCMTCVLGLSLPALGIAFLGGIPILGFAAATVIGPIAGYAPNIFKAKKAAPLYAKAIARIKFGKYKEAEWEIIKELEKAEDDFNGWMMLAELYAKNFNDLPEAEQTVLEICDHPRTTPSQLSIALHRLSEWHLNLATNPYAARRALQMICHRLRGTHLAHMAQLRINQLPQTEEQLMEMRNPRPIKLPERHPQKANATAAANACVAKLNLDPNDIPAREKLAHILSEQLGQAEEGIEQLMLLLNMPEASDAKRAQWLGTIGQWHMELRQDLELGKKFLDRLVREFPQSPEAAAARQQLQPAATGLNLG